MQTTHMQKFFLFLLLGISVSLLSGCRKEILVPNPDFNHLFGTWRWIQSSGGPTDETINPTTENHSMSLEYRENGIYKRFQNDKKIEKLCFTFEESTSIYSQNQEYLIEYSEGRWSKLGVIPHSFEFIGMDTLYLRDECNSCYTHIYVKED